MIVGWVPLLGLLGIWVHAGTRRRRDPDAPPLRRGAVVLLVVAGLLAVTVVAVAVFAAVVLHGLLGTVSPLVTEARPPGVDVAIATAFVHHPSTVLATSVLAAGAAATVRHGRVQPPAPASD